MGTGSGLSDYLRWSAERGRSFAGYAELHSWSVADLAGFWTSVWEFCGVRGDTGVATLGSRDMPGARWFPGARLNYAEQIVGEHALGAPEDVDRVAVIARSQTRGPVELTFGELADQVGRARAGLARLGVTAGDRVVGYLPNVPEALVAYLACASLGAVWSCCAPEFGARGVVDRFAQLDPTVLLTVGGYTHGRKEIDKRADVAAVRAGLPTLRHVVALQYGPYPADGTLTWDDLLAEQAAPEFERLPFDHPLHVLFSSGTTGLPKAIVHGHGGIVLEHLKTHALHLDSRPGDRVLWFTTTAWTMWNITIGALLRGAAVVLTDGDVLHPDLLGQWDVAAETGATLMGTSPSYLMACRKAGVRPPRLPALRTIGVTGAPLPAEGHVWAEQLGARVNVFSGGTDVCSAFVGGNPWSPSRPGEMSAAWLGVDAAALDDAGRPVVGELGELVVRAPMPSMPLRFWNDPGDERYRASYFDTYPGVWRHGDWATVTAGGAFVVSGRSDATLNRGGVRLGTAEFYAVVDDLPEVRDSLVEHLEDDEGGPGRLVLFVVADGGLTDELAGRIRAALRAQLSPRHSPDEIVAVPAVPRTLTGKRLEKPVKQILQGRTPTDVVSPDAVTDFAALEAFRLGVRT